MQRQRCALGKETLRQRENVRKGREVRNRMVCSGKATVMLLTVGAEWERTT